MTARVAHTDLIRLASLGPSPKGKGIKSYLPAFPFRGRCPRRGRMRYLEPGTVGSANSGAELEAHRKQILQTQGPVARREIRHSLKFCAPEMTQYLSGGAPVNGVRGARLGANPGGVLVTLPPRAKSLAARRRRHPLAKTSRFGAPSRRALHALETCPLIRPLRGHLPYPLWPSAISP